MAAVDADHDEPIRYDIGAATPIFLKELEPLASFLTIKLQHSLSRLTQVGYAMSAVDADHDDLVCFREFLVAAVHCVVSKSSF